MVILINPMLSNYRNLNADSCYVVIKKIIQPIIDKYPDEYNFVIPFPKKGFTYTSDGFFEQKQITRVPMEMPQRKMDMVINFPIMYWRKFFKVFTPDIIWNHVPEVGHLFKNLYTSFDAKSTAVAVFNQHHYIIHESLPYPIEPYRAVQFQSMGSVLVDLNIFNSDHCKRMFDDVVNEYGANKTLNFDIIKFAFIEKTYPEPKPDEKVIKIAYNHRLQDYKNYLETFEILDQLYQQGYKFKVIVTNPNGSNFNKLINYPFVEGKTIANHDEYLKELSTCHLNIINSQHETFCISALESLAFGQVLVAPNAITFPELVYPDYPYLFNNEEEQYNILKKIFDDPTILDKERPKIREWTMSEFNNEKISEKYNELFQEHGKRKTGELKAVSRKAFADVTTTNKGFVDLKTIQQQLGKYNLGWQAFPLIKIKRVLNNMGYKDEVKGLRQGFNFK